MQGFELMLTRRDTRRVSMLGLLLVVGCAAAAPPARSPRPVSTPVVQAVPEPALAPPPRSEAANRCLPDGPPKPLPREPEHDVGLCVDHRKTERVLRPKLEKRYDRQTKDGTVEVSFGCDPLTASIVRIEVETGSGHGGSLQLWQLTRKDDEDHFDVLAVANDTYYGAPAKVGDQPGIFVARGAISVRDLETVLAEVRPLLTTRVRELEPKGLGLGTVSFSSADFHARIALEDDSGHVLARSYTGYPTSSSQQQYLGLRLAMTELSPVLEQVAFQPELPNAELRSWYVVTARRAWPRVQGQYAWWVRERLVAMAGKAGDRSLVPMVVQELRRGLREIEKAKAEDKKSLADRYLTEPLDVLARITGWDPRHPEDGSERALPEAAREAVSECDLSPSS